MGDKARGTLVEENEGGYLSQEGMTDTQLKPRGDSTKSQLRKSEGGGLGNQQRTDLKKWVFTHHLNVTGLFTGNHEKGITKYTENQKQTER